MADFSAIFYFYDRNFSFESNLQSICLGASVKSVLFYMVQDANKWFFR